MMPSLRLGSSKVGLRIWSANTEPSTPRTLHAPPSVEAAGLSRIRRIILTPISTHLHPPLDIQQLLLKVSLRTPPSIHIGIIDQLPAFHPTKRRAAHHSHRANRVQPIRVLDRTQLGAGFVP